jgi:hypothetical protein
MNKINSRPIHQRKLEPEFNVTNFWFTQGTEEFARKQVWNYYKRARRILLLSPFQARVYTLGRIAETPIFSLKKEWEIGL